MTAAADLTIFPEYSDSPSYVNELNCLLQKKNFSRWVFAYYVQPSGGHLCFDLETVANPPSVRTIKGAAQSCYIFHFMALCRDSAEFNHI